MKRRPVNVPSWYPGYTEKLRKLKVGGSLKYPDTVKIDTARARAKRAFGTGNYAVRKVDGGVRVWRIK